MDSSSESRDNRTGCPFGEYWESNKGCQSCKRVCRTFQEDQCKWHCSKWRLSVLETTTEPVPVTTTPEPVPMTTQESFGSETTVEPFSETTFNIRETNASGNAHNGNSEMDTVAWVIGTLVLLSLIAIVTICCAVKLRRKYKRIQDEKTKACQETERSEDKPRSDFQYDILNRRPTEYPQLYPQLVVDPITTNIPNVHSDSTLNDELPHPENRSTTGIPNPNHGQTGEDKYHAEDNPADTDQTLLKVLATDPAPSPDVQSARLSHTSPRDRPNTIPESTHSLSNTPPSGSEGSLHRVPLHRAQRAPTTFIAMPPLEEETSFITPGQASPDPVVTEVIVTTATPDNTTKSSITRLKWNGHLYRGDVNQPEDDEAGMAIQPVHNIP